LEAVSGVENYLGDSGFRVFISVVVIPLFAGSVKLHVLVGVRSGGCGILNGTL
jgi:hypothetical protein